MTYEGPAGAMAVRLGDDLVARLPRIGRGPRRPRREPARPSALLRPPTPLPAPLPPWGIYRRIDGLRTRTGNWGAFGLEPRRPGANRPSRRPAVVPQWQSAILRRVDHRVHRRPRRCRT